MNNYRISLENIFEVLSERNISPQTAEFLEYNVQSIEELISEKEEFESRKDKLVVGSEWICEVDCSGTLNTWGAGGVGKIISVNHRIVEVVDAQFDEQDFFTTAEFPRLFKPKGEK